MAGKYWTRIILPFSRKSCPTFETTERLSRSCFSTLQQTFLPNHRIIPVSFDALPGCGVLTKLTVFRQVEGRVVCWSTTLRLLHSEGLIRLAVKDTTMENTNSKEEVSSTTTTTVPVKEGEVSGDSEVGSTINVVETSSTSTTTTSTSTSKVVEGVEQAQAESSTSISEDQVSQSDKKDTPSTEGDGEERKKVLLRKRKSVLMLSYCGQGYLGMQKNPGMKTIEDDVLRSLLTAGYIDEEAYHKPQVMQFQRAARTDKHVSAARQIVSLKLPDKVDLDEVNKLLPPEIRIMGLKKVTKGFDCKGSCDARTYMYMIPSFAFTPLEQPVDETYRITPEVLESLRQALKLYLGTDGLWFFKYIL
jgi:tRNA pseudouridine(38-40) synthase